MGRVTLQTIADRVGVSRMTVSNAFAKPDQLSADLRRRILREAEQLGYIGPDPTARALSNGRAGAVGILLTDTLGDALTDQVAMTFLGAIADELAPTGLALTLLSSTSQNGYVPARDVPVDGALVYSCNPDSSAVGWLMRRRLPVVFIDQAPAPGIPSVNVDDRAGARAAAAHVIDLGHRRVGIVSAGVGGPHGVIADPRSADAAYVERHRLLGWLDALEPVGISPIVVREPHGNPEAAGENAGRVLAETGVTSILCFSDAMAFGVIRALREAGLRVPDDVSVVGFDDNPLAARADPPLTTVRQDVAAKGRSAAAALLVAIESAKDGAGNPRARHALLAAELVIRGSTAAPARADKAD